MNPPIGVRFRLAYCRVRTAESGDANPSGPFSQNSGPRLGDFIKDAAPVRVARRIRLVYAPGHRRVRNVQLQGLALSGSEAAHQNSRRGAHRNVAARISLASRSRPCTDGHQTWMQPDKFRSPRTCSPVSPFSSGHSPRRGIARRSTMSNFRPPMRAGAPIHTGRTLEGSQCAQRASRCLTSEPVPKVFSGLEIW